MFNRRVVVKSDVEMLVSAVFSCNKKIYQEIVKLIAANDIGITYKEMLQILSSYKESIIKSVIMKLERDELIEVQPDSGLYVFKERWKNVVAMIKNHMERTNQMEIYRTSSTVKSREEYLPIIYDDENEGGLLY